MKKKQQKGEGLTLEFLQKKYQEEKHILAKQNKRLSAELMQEIERYNALVSRMEKDQEEANYRLEELMRENQQLKAKVLDLERQEESISIHEEQEIQILNEQKRLILENESLHHEKQELEVIIEKIYQEKVHLEQELEHHHSSEAELHQEMETLALKHDEFKRESQRQIEELVQANRIALQEKDKQTHKYSELKKKKKDLEKKVEELERLAENIKHQESRVYEQLQQVRSEKDREHQKVVELSTKYALSQAKVINLENYLARTEEQLREADKKAATENQRSHQLQHDLDKAIVEYKNLEDEFQRQREETRRLEIEVEKTTLSKEEIIRAMRRNQTEELIGIIKQGASEGSQQQLNKYSSGASLAHGNLSDVNRGQFDAEDRLVERAKLEMMINNLENDLAQSRRQAESSTYQLQRLKRAYEDKALEIQRKESELKEMRLRTEKLETDRNRQLVTLRNENQLLRCRETESIQKNKEIQQYKSAIALKLAFYQRKIKEHLDTIDRKQTIIEKLQLHKNESEDKHRLVEDHLRKMNDEIEFLRKFKQDCSRKDELLKDYRVKLDKIKQENEELKSELAQLKRQKQRLDKQIDSKQQYIASLKARQQKGPQDKNEDALKENKKMSQLRNGYEHKLVQMKKEKQVLRIYLNEIRDVIMNKVEEYLAKQIPTSKKQVPQYEAAKLLGIKPGQIEEFLNPKSVLNKKILEQLEADWAEGNYSDFVVRFIDYLAVQKQK